MWDILKKDKYDKWTQNSKKNIKIVKYKQNCKIVILKILRRLELWDINLRTLWDKSQNCYIKRCNLIFFVLFYSIAGKHYDMLIWYCKNKNNNSEFIEFCYSFLQDFFFLIILSLYFKIQTFLLRIATYILQFYHIVKKSQQTVNNKLRIARCQYCMINRRIYLFYFLFHSRSGLPYICLEDTSIYIF